MLRVMNGAGRPPAAEDSPDARVRRATGSWVGYLIFALMLLLLIDFDAQAAYQHQWARFASYVVFTLIFLVVPTGGVKWIRRRVSARKQASAVAVHASRDGGVR